MCLGTSEQEKGVKASAQPLGETCFSFFHSSGFFTHTETHHAHLFTNQLLPQELTSLKHVGDVVEWTETFVFVLGLLLNDKEGESYSCCSFKAV